MIEKVLSGGQAGADQAGWRAAKRFGIPTGGWMPRGFLTEDGPRPEFAALYGATEMPTADYGLRTDANVRLADWILWFGDQSSPGGRRTRRACERFGPGWLGVDYPEGRNLSPSEVAEVCRAQGCGVILIAGNRESKAPGIGAWVEAYLAEVFGLLGFAEVQEGA